MKYTYFKTILTASLGILIIANSGCRKLEDFDNTNIRTDASLIPVTSNLLTSSEASLGALASGNIAGRPASIFVQMFAETQYTDVSLYGTPQLDFSTTYTGPLINLQKIIDLNTDDATKSLATVLGTAANPQGSNNNQIATARILKAYYYWTITDRWGDIPYSEALKGNGNLSPKYDKQEDIYTDLLNELTEANDQFDGGFIVKGDYIYGGSIAKWKRLANSLRMLMALRLSKVYPSPTGFAATEFAAAYNDANGAITTNANNFNALFDAGTTLTTNPWYNALNGRLDYAFSKTMADLLTNISDPRINSFATSGTPFPYGLERLDAVDFEASTGTISRLFAAAYRSTTTPVALVPAAYVLLAEAEAAQRGWITADAKTLYDNGVTQSFLQWGRTSSEAAAYLAGEANFNSGNGGGNSIGTNSYGSIVGSSAVTTTSLERINLQQFIAAYADGIYAWSNWRRTRIPRLTPTTYGRNNPREIPRRYTYGVSEYASNGANVAAAAARLAGGDVMSARMWWDLP